MLKNKKQKKNDIAVVLIDMQAFFLKDFSSSVRNTLIKNQSYVIKICVAKKLPFIVLEYKTNGISRGKIIKSLDREIKNGHKDIFIKENNSGFAQTKLESILKESGIKTLLLMGVNANGCVQDTAIGALHRGFNVVTSEGLIASSSRNDLELSKRNRDWYLKNTILKKTLGDLIGYLNQG